MPPSLSCSRWLQLINSAARLIAVVQNSKASEESAVLVKWPVRVKVFIGIGLLLAMVAILSSSGLYSTYAYRTLVKTLSWRVSELPLAAEMSAHVADMRVTLSEVRGLRASGSPDSQPELLSLRVEPGQAAVCQPAWRRGRHLGRVLQPAGPQTPGRRQYWR